MAIVNVDIDKVFPRDEQGSVSSGISLSKLREAILNNTALEAYPIGTEIPDVWRNISMERAIHLEMKLDTPWIVAHHGTIIPLGASTPKPITYLVSKFAYEPTRLVRTDNVRRVILESYFDTETHRRLNDKDSLFFNGCSDELLRVVASISVTSAATNLKRLGYPYWITHHGVKFFVPSLCELGFDQGYGSKYEGTPWELFQDRAPVFTDHDGKACSYWTRTLDPTKNLAWCISEAGAPFSASTFTKKHLIVACAVM